MTTTMNELGLYGANNQPRVCCVVVWCVAYRRVAAGCTMT